MMLKKVKTKKCKRSKNKKHVKNEGWEVSEISEENESRAVEIDEKNITVSEPKHCQTPSNHNARQHTSENIESVGNQDISDKASENVESVENQDISDKIAETVVEGMDPSLVSKGKTKKNKVIQRSEASQNISEFNLTEVGKERVKLNELIKTSQKLSGQVSVKKQLEKAKKLKRLSVPLTKPQLQKISRTVAYEKVCEEVKKWDPVVHGNRAADQIIYPLKKPDLSLDTFENVSQQFVTKHPVEIAVSELLNKSQNKLEKTKVLTAAEEKALQAMSLEEAKLRHSELMKHRALISYQEAKARRQNRIKSKRYHRLLKREKLKKIMKEFEQLEKVDIKAALEKIMDADKLRVLERMTLKHRNTGKWAKIQKLRAKYNPEARSVLKEDINMGKQLREKLPVVEETINKLKSTLESQADNDMNEDSLYNDGLIEESSGKGRNNLDALLPVSGVVDENEFKEKDCPVETATNLDRYTVEKPEEQKKTKSSSGKMEDAEFIDMEFISKTTSLDSYKPSRISIGDNMDDESGGESVDGDADADRIKSVSEAFADEDIIAEFREEKKASERENQPEGIDLYLPGWGSWGGPGIKDSERKRKRFFISAELPPPKKDTLGSVIFNEEKDKKAAVHQVNALPFPFTNVTQFESFIRQPIGHTWNPQSSFQNLNAPKVITKMGKIIEPIDAEDVIVQKPSVNKNRKPPFNKNGKQPFNKTGKPPFNKTGKPPFNKTGKPPFNKTGKPPFNKNGKPPFKNSKKPNYEKKKKLVPPAF